MALLSPLGIADEQAHELLRSMVERGYIMTEERCSMFDFVLKIAIGFSRTDISRGQRSLECASAASS